MEWRTGAVNTDWSVGTYFPLCWIFLGRLKIPVSLVDQRLDYLLLKIFSAISLVESSADFFSEKDLAYQAPWTRYDISNRIINRWRGCPSVQNPPN